MTNVNKTLPVDTYQVFIKTQLRLLFKGSLVQCEKFVESQRKVWTNAIFRIEKDGKIVEEYVPLKKTNYSKHKTPKDSMTTVEEIVKEFGEKFYGHFHSENSDYWFTESEMKKFISDKLTTLETKVREEERQKVLAEVRELVAYSSFDMTPDGRPVKRTCSIEEAMTELEKDLEVKAKLSKESK